MADVLTKDQRQRCMAAIKSKDTKPEMLVRRVLHAAGFRYKLNVRSLPGSPDIVLPSLRHVVQVHGCFWHSHSCRYGQVIPKTNAEAWTLKREKTMVRDTRAELELAALGWRSITVWECELREKGYVQRSVIPILLAARDRI